MKQIFDFYGKFLLEAVVLTAFLVLLFTGVSDGKGNRGVLQITGANLPKEEVDYNSYADADSGQEESMKRAPEICFRKTAMVTLGTYKLSESVTATDYAGNLLPIKIVSVKAPDGSDVTDVCNMGTTEITLEQTGVYAVTVSAKDGANRKRIKTVQIPVNE